MKKILLFFSVLLQVLLVKVAIGGVCYVSWLVDVQPGYIQVPSAEDMIAYASASSSTGLPCAGGYTYRPMCADEDAFLLVGNNGGSNFHVSTLQELIGQFSNFTVGLIYNGNTVATWSYPINSGTLYPFFVPLSTQHSFTNANPGVYQLVINGIDVSGSNPVTRHFGTMQLFIFPTQPLLEIQHTQTNCSLTGPHQVCFDLPPFTIAQLVDYVEWEVIDNASGAPVSVDQDWCAYMQNGSYTVTAKIGNLLYADPQKLIDCLPTTQINIQPLSVAVSPSSYTGCNTGSSFTLSTTVTGGTAPYSYTWSPAVGLSANNVPNPTFSPVTAITGNYNVTVTDANQCTATSIFTNNMIYCCLGYNLNNSNNIATFYDVSTSMLNWYVPWLVNNNVLQANYSANQVKVAFNGTLHVNTDFTIKNSPNITFGPGAKVIVEPGVTLKVENSTLTACDEFLWEGIIATQEGSLTLGGTNKFSVIIDNSRIKQAFNSVAISGSARVDIRNSRFENDYVGLSFNNVTNSLSVITNNVFWSTGNYLLPSWPGAATTVNAGWRSSNGIFANGSNSIDLGVVNLGNTFEGLCNGVAALNTSVNSVHSKFSIINSYNTGFLGNGWCFWAFDSQNSGVSSPYTITITGKGKQQVQADFEASPLAIYLREVNATITQNFIKYSSSASNHCRAIATELCNYDRITIADNRINTYRYGIDLLNNKGAIHTIARNHITVAQPIVTADPPNNYSGINLTYTQQADNFVSEILYDTIINGRFGVTCQNASTAYGFQYLDISNCHIFMNGTGAYDGLYPDPFLNSNPANRDLHGIYLVNCTGGYGNATLRSNTIYGTNGAHRNFKRYRKSAITIENSPGNHIQCNNMYWVGIGLQARGRNGGTVLRRNNFGIQAGATNYDLNYSTVYRKMAAGDGYIGPQGSNTECLANQYVPISYAGGVQVYTVYNDPNTSHPAIFDDGITNSIYNITQFGHYNSVNAQDNIGSSFTEWTCSGIANMPEGGGEGSSMALLGTEQDIVDVISGQAVLQFEVPFMQGGQWLKERDLYREATKDSIAELSNDLQQFVADKQPESVGRLEDLDRHMQQLMAAGSTPDTSTQQATRATLLQENGTVPASEMYEINEKIINQLDLLYLATGSMALSAQEQEQVAQIAYQCPLIGGKAVYKARAIHLLYNREADFDDFSLCNLSSGKTDGLVTQAPTTLRFGIAPNPAGNLTYLQYRLLEAETARVEIYNNFGTLLYTGTLAAEEQLHPLRTGTLSNGVYLLRVTQQGEQLYETKVVVSH